jgi:Uma2 family endonuclease
MIPAFGPTLADLVEGLGGVPLERIPLRPPPGTATEEDVLAARHTPERWLCELVDGALVLKAPGFAQSVLGGLVGSAVLNYLHQHDRGPGFGASAMYRLKAGLVRIPDFSYVSWQRLPGGKVPDVEIADFIPDLIVELPRSTHTQRELDRKVREYLDAGVRLVWMIHYPQQSAAVYTATTEPEHIPAHGALHGGEVLPGLVVPLASLFTHLEARGRSQ